MPEKKEKQYAIWADRDTHTELAVMAARRKVSIKQCLKEMVEKEKEKEKEVHENGTDACKSLYEKRDKELSNEKY